MLRQMKTPWCVSFLCNIKEIKVKNFVFTFISVVGGMLYHNIIACGL
jgi:hypothetical protein